MSRECLFCRIASGEMKAEILFDDEHVLAFRDINPQAPVHALIIPRRHCPSLASPEADDPAMLNSLRKAVEHLAGQLPAGSRDYRLVVNYGSSAGQTVFHLHWHFLAGRPFRWPPG